MENLARESVRENLNILRVSYNELSRRDQNIFLDVACFSKGEYKDFVTKMLDGHDFSPKERLKVLTDRCLITVSKTKLLICDPNLVLGLCSTLKANGATFVKKKVKKKGIYYGSREV